MLEYLIYLKNLTNDINFYFSAICVPFGIFFNLITILVFQTSSFNSTNIRTFYTALGINDILALLNLIYILQLLPSLGINLLLYSQFLCKFLNMWRRLVIQTASWIQVIITYDRYKIVCESNHKLETKLRIILKFSIIFVVITLFNIPYLWYNLNEGT